MALVAVLAAALAAVLALAGWRLGRLGRGWLRR
jgi:hypothetical protein